MYMIIPAKIFNRYFKLGFIFLVVYWTSNSNLFAQTKINEILLTEDEQAWINKHPTIIASNHTGYAPFDFISAGEPVGLSIDFLDLLTSKVGLKVEYVNYGNLTGNIQMGIEQKIDVINTLVKNEERQQYFTFSDPVASDSVVFYGRVGTQRINNYEDLKNKRIGFIKEHTIPEFFKKNYPDLNYVEFNNNMEVLRALSANEIDIYPYVKAPIEFHISQNKLQGIEILGDNFTKENKSIDYRIAVHKKNPILMSIINKAMGSVTNAEFNEIAKKWLVVVEDEFQNKIQLSNEEINWLTNNPVIRTVAGHDNAPSSFINSEGKIDGIAGDYLNEIANRLNVEFVWAVNKSWNGGLEKILANEADIAVGASATPKREEFLSFSEMFMSYDTAIYSRTDGIHFTSLESLRGYTVVQVAGTANIDYLNEFYPDINIIEVDTLVDAIATLSNGEADAMTSDNLVASSAILKADVENLIISGIAPYNFANGIGIRKDLSLLASAIDKAVADISAERRQEIINKWTLLRFVPTTDYSYLLNIVYAGLILLVTSLIWNRKLLIARKQALNSKQEAEKANEAKTKFLANVSHELRTPLNSLLLLSQRLTKNNDNNFTNKQVEYINVIHNSGSELLHMVNDLLDLSKANANKITISDDEVNIEEIRSYLNQFFQPLMEEAGLEFTVTIDDKLPKSFVCDKQYLYQILKNLISNALKFTKIGSISVAIKLDIPLDDNEEKIIFSVTDSGIGIEKDMHQKIFEEFSQGDQDAGHNYGGTGLGLNISKRIANLMDGDITVSSKMGEGSTFNLSLPLPFDFLDTFETDDLLIPNDDSTDIENSSEIDEKDWGLVGKTILLVDDDERNLYSLAEVLNKYGINSITAERGAQALEILKDNLDIELVLMDMMMPGMDGDEAISRIRFTLRGENIPIIALTANAMPEHKEICLKAGANDFLTKPIHLETLLTKIREWL